MAIVPEKWQLAIALALSTSTAATLPADAELHRPRETPSSVMTAAHARDAPIKITSRTTRPYYGQEYGEESDRAHSFVVAAHDRGSWAVSMGNWDGPSGPTPSRWTDPTDLEAYGWQMKVLKQPAPGAPPDPDLFDARKIELEPAFRTLGISLEQNEWKSIRCEHSERGQNPAAGNYALAFNFGSGSIIAGGDPMLATPEATGSRTIGNDEDVPLREWSDIAWLAWTEMYHS